MSELKRCFEEAGFENVRTILSSGNIAFDARAASEATLQRKAEAAMRASLGRVFTTIVRPTDFLRRLLETDPYAPFDVAKDSKRVVTFLREAKAPRVPLPIEADGTRILSQVDREVFTAYVPSAKGAVFMAMIEKNFGAEVTTRTWDTVAKCASA